MGKIKTVIRRLSHDLETPRQMPDQAKTKIKKLTWYRKDQKPPTRPKADVAISLPKTAPPDLALFKPFGEPTCTYPAGTGGPKLLSSILPRH